MSQQADIRLAIAHLEELKKQQDKKEKRKKAQREYYLKNKEKVLATIKEWHKKNPDYMKNYNKKKREAENND